MCECRLCNMTEEEQIESEEAYIKWEYERFCKTSTKILSMDEWLNTLPKPK